MLEMVAVLVILGVLAALAFSIGPGIMGKADVKNLRDDLRGLELTQLTNSSNRAYLLDHDELADSEPNLSFTNAEASPGVISVVLSADGSEVGMAALSDDQVCVTLKVTAGSSSYATRTGQYPTSESEPCSGTIALLNEGESW